jgi:putative colanic acid polymerase
MRARLAAVLIFITVIFQHFQIFSLSGFPVTIGLLSGLSLLVIAGNPPKLTILAVILPSLAVISGTTGLMGADLSDFASFSRTFALIMLAATIVVSGASGSQENIISSPQVTKSLFAVLTLVVLLSVAQTISGSFGSLLLFNPFGTNQYLYNYNPHLAFNPIPRAQGFFLEPSYDAFVIGAVGAALLCTTRKTGLVAALVLAGLAACQSATGLVVFFVALFTVALRSRPSAAVGALLIALLAASVSGEYLIGRLTTITTAATSANYRLVAPLEVLGDVLKHSPLGLPLGSIERVMVSYGLQNGATVGSSLDNGFYVLIFYFGWIGIAGIVVWIGASIKSMRVRISDGGAGWIAPLWLLASMFFSGGIVLPEFALMTWLVLVSYGRRKETDVKFDRAAGSERHHREFSRP